MYKKGMSKVAFISFLVIVFSVIFLAIIFFLSKADDFDSNKYSISYESLVQGVEVPLEKNTILVIDYNEKNNSIFLNDFSKESVSGSYLSKSFILKISEVYEIDLDQEGSSDVGLNLSKRNGTFYLEIFNLEFFECMEDWICSNWTPCINGKKERVCVDNNLCGTFENEPETVLYC